MTQKFNIRFLPFLVIPAVASLLLLGSAHYVVGQDGGGGGGGGAGVGGGDGDGDAGQVPVLDNGNDGAATGGGGGTTGGADGEIDSVEPIRLEFEIPDRRNQGFVGATAPGIEDINTNESGFVGPLTGDPDGENAEGRFIGGGTNAGIGNRTATTSSAELQENGFSVQRRGIRTRLRPAFAAPTVPSIVAERRFQSRMTRQPVVRQFGQGVTISIGNKTAVMSGFVSSTSEREIIKRQLRLEPGVYKIEDRTVIAK